MITGSLAKKVAGTKLRLYIDDETKGHDADYTMTYFRVLAEHGKTMRFARNAAKFEVIAVMQKIRSSCIKR